MPAAFTDMDEVVSPVLHKYVPVSVDERVILDIEQFSTVPDVAIEFAVAKLMEP